jgi:hypothetical protein
VFTRQNYLRLTTSSVTTNTNFAEILSVFSALCWGLLPQRLSGRSLKLYVNSRYRMRGALALFPPPPSHTHLCSGRGVEIVFTMTSGPGLRSAQPSSSWRIFPCQLSFSVKLSLAYDVHVFTYVQCF